VLKGCQLNPNVHLQKNGPETEELNLSSFCSNQQPAYINVKNKYNQGEQYRHPNLLEAGADFKRNRFADDAFNQ
jgi:hypothetical protein